MLSILLPIYNYNVTHLVTELRRQAEAEGVVYEICLLDDASSEEFQVSNRDLIRKTNIRYEELPQNIGRSAIRNRLVKMAKFDYLLFMDCDSGVLMPNYIRTYLEVLHPQRLLYGGRAYLPKPPSDPQYLLHWHYGRQREQKDFLERQKNPYHSFMTNNFLIPKSIFSSITFDESLRNYGHEDTLFGMELAKMNIEILHLNNPLLHLGLESASVFLAKTKMAVDNLAQLQQQGKRVETRLSQTYTQLIRWKLLPGVAWGLKMLRPFLLKHLQRPQKVDLRYLDLYKMDLYIQAMHKAV
ncbi:MAG: glycosyltransferase [Haliscomenobacter sp.]|uniref:glycosyltransferase family 2 protein n=1 Tax=Haliscomenobacter sp. TaxID=2717303 RepID=UPI0029AB5DC2|nr:glycosyltransferase [Haliscomenobacter sp.]MDX2067969.1 glycosyltransferase [Haliscomenobacter sp.]